MRELNVDDTSALHCMVEVIPLLKEACSEGTELPWIGK